MLRQPSPPAGLVTWEPTMPETRMTALDAWFLHLEDEADHMHIGSVGVFEGPPPTWEELRDRLAAKLDVLPRYRQRVQRARSGSPGPSGSTTPTSGWSTTSGTPRCPRPAACRSSATSSAGS
jgi:hypothetical protein